MQLSTSAENLSCLAEAQQATAARERERIARGIHNI
jgi:hypothetical protein